MLKKFKRNKLVKDIEKLGKLVDAEVKAGKWLFKKSFNRRCLELNTRILRLKDKLVEYTDRLIFLNKVLRIKDTYIAELIKILQDNDIKVDIKYYQKRFDKNNPKFRKKS